MADLNFGTDLALADGFEAHFPLASGQMNLGMAAFRRITTGGEAGTAIYAGQCTDVRDLFVARLDASRLPSIAKQVESAILYDGRIEAAECRATFNFSRKRLELAINLTPADGSVPFSLVLSVDSLTVEILNG